MNGITFINRKLYTLKRLFHYHARLPMLRIKQAVCRRLVKDVSDYDFVIIDDTVPKTVSGFRGYEFAYFLKSINRSALFSIIGDRLTKKKKFDFYPIKSIRQYKAATQNFIAQYHTAPSQLQPLQPWTKINAHLAYVVFLNNGAYLIDYIEERKMKFILELYPGGGLSLAKEGYSWVLLQRVLGSPALAYVITTQLNTYRFVLENKLCPPEKVAYIYGAILAPEFMALPAKAKRFGVNKDTLDICFVASKNMPRGEDKGYDVFVETAHLLLAHSNIFNFYVVGGFTDADMPIAPAYRANFHFYNYLETDQFVEFYLDKDIFMSPNRANTLGKGAFDGFPTGTAAEAALHGLCLLLSDPLNLNTHLEPGRDAIILQHDPEQYAQHLLRLASEPQRIYEIGENGKKIYQQCLSYEEQLGQRMKLINKSLPGNS